METEAVRLLIILNGILVIKRTLNGSMFKVIDDYNNVYDYSIEGTIALEMAGEGLGSMFLKQCQPNVPTDGEIVFEVPKKSDDYTLIISSGFWSGETGKILLRRYK